MSEPKVKRKKGGQGKSQNRKGGESKKGKKSKSSMGWRVMNPTCSMHAARSTYVGSGHPGEGRGRGKEAETQREAQAKEEEGRSGELAGGW